MHVCNLLICKTYFLVALTIYITVGLGGHLAYGSEAQNNVYVESLFEAFLR